MCAQPSWYSSFLSSLSPGTQDLLLSMARRVRYRAGEFIFRDGDRNAQVFLLNSGQVKVLMNGRFGKQVTVVSLGPGDLFGWSALVEPRIATASARAVTECEVLAISADAIVDLARHDANFGCELYRAVVEVTATRLRATRLQLLDLFSNE
jgi:CRP/FNR family cyclic AMP-dependent transcriptional regulator